MCPRGRPRGQGRPLGLHLCLLHTTKYALSRNKKSLLIGSKTNRKMQFTQVKQLKHLSMGRM